MIEPHEQDMIRTWNDTLEGERSLRILVTEDPRSERFASFGETLCALASRVSVSTKRMAATGAPTILVSNRLRYCAVPAGTELTPFLEAVQRCGTARATTAESGSGANDRTATDVYAYVSPRCPHCPGATRDLVRLLDVEPTMTLTVVDAEFFPEIAAGDRVRSVPTVIAGRRYRSAGTVWIEDVRAVLAGKPPDAAALGRMLDGGDAEAVASMMIDAGEVFPGVLDRLAHDVMSARLGAMTAIERFIGAVPAAAQAAEIGICERVAHAGPQAAGDLIYLLGEIGTPASLHRIAAWLEQATDDDLREAASDAMARIAERVRLASEVPLSGRRPQILGQVHD